MSKRGYERFRRALDADVQLAQKLRERVAEAGPTEEVEATAAFARAHGFPVDAMDVRRARM